MAKPSLVQREALCTIADQDGRSSLVHFGITTINVCLREGWVRREAFHTGTGTVTAFVLTDTGRAIVEDWK